MSSPLMTVKQAADLLNLSTKTIYRSIETGDLPHHTFGRAIRISKVDLELFANKHKRGGIFSHHQS
ncbi:helix-turn-helix domain-containing protein [Nisaea sp.]|uniref:helix-turn-helix domain-containing protein n=1 Tax=Nisaea sp. TaxID=2024842 RepID=UPI0032EAD4F4